MSHFLCLLIIAVALCIGLGSITGHPTDKIQKQWNTVQKLNKGRYANPMLNVSIEDEGALKENIRTVYKDLKCSYLSSVLMHLKLTEHLATEEQNLAAETTFWNEGRQILEFMNHIHIDELRSSISTLQSELSMFWIFAMYTERVQKYSAKHFDRNEEAEKSLSVMHAAVTELFDNCLNDCTAYNQQTGLPLEDVSLLDEIHERVSSAKDQYSKILLINENKIEFIRQVDDNKQLIPVHDECIDQLKMKCMCLNNVHSSDGDMTILVQYLGMFDKNSIPLFVKILSVPFEVVVSTTATLHKQMVALDRFQQNFIEILKAIALRIAREHLECLNNGFNDNINSTSQTQTMYTVLSQFFDHFNLAAYKEPLMHRVIEEFRDPAHYLKEQKQIVDLMNYIDQSLDTIKNTIQCTMSLKKNSNIIVSDLLHLIKYIKSRKNRPNKHLVKLANLYGVLPENGDGNKLLEENVLRGKIFIEFIRDKFRCSNFHFIWSYSSIVASELVEDLEHIENQIKKGDNDSDSTDVGEGTTEE